MSVLEIVGTVLGIIGVFLMIRQNIWAWPVGLVQVVVYSVVFYQAKLYSDALLQWFFFGIQAYGWVHWLRGGSATQPLPVTRLRPVHVAAWIGVGVLVACGWGTFMATRTDAAMPYWDAFIFIFSLISQWLQARKKLECWAGWVVVNTVAIGVFWVKELHLTAGLYVVFWAMAVWGWIAWQKGRQSLTGDSSLSSSSP